MIARGLPAYLVEVKTSSVMKVTSILTVGWCEGREDTVGVQVRSR